MKSFGNCYYKKRGESYYIFLEQRKGYVELVLTQPEGIKSAYKKDLVTEYIYGNKDAMDLWKSIEDGLRKCKKNKNRSAVPFILGVAERNTLEIKGRTYIIDRYNEDICRISLSSDEIQLDTDYNEYETANIDYVKRTQSTIKMVSADEFSMNDYDDIPVRTLEEIVIESGKDLAWLDNKKYYIVNDEATAEQIFQFMDNYNGIISYDTETSGLRINMFGKIGSKYKKDLEDYNSKANAEDRIRVDYLVGIILCVEPNVSYYFPCANRKFKNLYSEYNEETRKAVEKLKAEYTVGKYRDRKDDMAVYIRNTQSDEIPSDVILMERCRSIFETKHILAHNGIFEWKVCWLYNIAMNLADDTMIMHKLMYKFRSTTSNRGEPSDLKTLSKVELNIDQLSLEDFFPTYKESNSGTVRNRGKKKKGSNIDFSFMDYEGAKAYAPADGDCTLQIALKYKKDLLENHREIEYIYQVELLVSCAIGQMEFYGHRIDVQKIEETRKNYILKENILELQLREIGNLGSASERVERNSIIERYNNKEDTDTLINDIEKLKENMEDVVNFGAPVQVASLFYNRLGIPADGSNSVAGKVLKPLLKEKNEDGTPKYPIVHTYAEWKKANTMLTKFFDKLQDFMYPGGFIFSHYGQIAAATGRMSCSSPNAQQYPKDVSAIVVPRDGYVDIDADYSQIEYRTLAALANEGALLKQFENPDADYHTTMASMMFGVPYAEVTRSMRSDAKTFNFGIPYGMGIKSLALGLSGNTSEKALEEASEKYEMYMGSQPNVRKFFNRVREGARVYGRTRTRWNRERWYNFIDADGNRDGAKIARASRQAGNAVIQGTAADIFKIGVARTYMFIKSNNLIGKVIVINMIHDEQLLEVSCDLNVKKVLTELIRCMSLKLDGFPPLYVGAGVNLDWKHAKGEMSEVHPVLAEEFAEETRNESLYTSMGTPEEVVKYFDDRLYKFREQKVINYLLDSNNYHKMIEPVIGSLIHMQFDHNIDTEGKSSNAILLEELDLFQKERNLGIDMNNFKIQQEQSEDIDYQYKETDSSEDIEYGDVEDEDMEYEAYLETANEAFALLDNDESMYGVDLRDVISKFGFIISRERHIIGVDCTALRHSKRNDVMDFLAEHQVEPSEDSEALQVYLLLSNNVLKETPVYVSNINEMEFAKEIGIQNFMYR